MWRKFILSITRAVILTICRLRYRIKVLGKEVLKDPRLKDKGILILPNHTAEVDPLLLLSVLGTKHLYSPLVTESFYNYPIANIYMRILKAYSVPNLEKLSHKESQKQKAMDLLHNVEEGLKAKKRFLLYPSGRLKSQGKEIVGGMSLTWSLLQKAPETEIVLVRMTGFWGSKFSKAYTGGKTPSFWKTALISFKDILCNLIFFSPRKKLTIEFSLPEDNFPKHADKRSFNHALECFYNQFYVDKDTRVESEPLNQVPRYFWRRKASVQQIKDQKNPYFQEQAVPNSVRQDIMYQLSEVSERSVRDIHLKDRLIEELGLDSLQVAEIFSYVDTHYDMEPGVEPGDLKTVEDVFAAAMRMLKGTRKEEIRVPMGLHSWGKSNVEKRPEAQMGDGKTIIESFLNTADRMKNFAACADQSSGILTYHTLKRAAIILAKRIEKFEGEYVGVMLPSSCGLYISILAILLAGKTPVPLNWTIGPYFMDHAIDLLDIKHIFTSHKFLDRLQNVEVGKAFDRFIYLEDFKASLGFTEKLRGAFLAKKKASTVLSKFAARHKTEDDTAVVLFTSGTTQKPKAVTLTHKNIMANQKVSLEMIDIHRKDVFIMALPGFHVFGFNLGLMTLTIGVRSVFFPDPLDGSLMGKEILKWGVSVVILAPTFFIHLFRNTTIHQLKSIRLCISGAEKAPDYVKDFIQKLGATFMEGYGLTETSPIISVNPCSEKPRGVGKILPNVDLTVIDPEGDRHKLGVDQVGEICVAGDSVFSGYYKGDNTDVFAEIDGKKYFKTGDLGRFDQDGFLYLEGRLKLSFKRGGEMINVVLIAEKIFEIAKEKGWIDPETDRNPFFALPNDTANGMKVVLFSEIDISLDQVNKGIIEKGFSRLYKVNEIRVIESIPINKAGKVQLHTLFQSLEKK